jgi:NADH:ubiquinone oxidoreductase subunit E
MCGNVCNNEHLGVAKIIDEYKNIDGSLIIVLQKTQELVGYLPKIIIKQIATGLNISEAEVYGVASFYSQFHLTPRGKNIIQVCTGTACHVNGSAEILKELEEILQIRTGETTDDLNFTLETVACVGSCVVAPVITINNQTYGKITAKDIASIIKSIHNN